MVTLQDVAGNVLFRKITFAKHVNITDQKEDEDTSIQDEKKT